VSSPPADGVRWTGADDVPVCFRHPDRESYVRCQRCERPICPECQLPAAVGVQCVDCVREASRTTRVPRTVFGGGAAGGRPVVTLSLIAICVGVYLLQLLPGSNVTQRFMFVPYRAAAEPWLFITSAFLHSPTLPLHIMFNMYALWLVGPYLESLLGRARFLVLYLMAALGGSAFLLLLATPAVASASWVTGAVGASGAVFGLFAAYVVVNRRMRRDSSAIIATIGLNALLSFVPGIAWQAHLGGLLTGGVVAAVLAYAPPARRSLMQALGLLVVTVAVVLLVLAKLAAVPSALLA
jgi:membrane associated rhomboid family serine protease